MANRLPSPTANNDGGVSVMFKLLPDSTAMIELPDDGISPDDRMLNNAEGAVDAALEIIFAAPTFDQYSATEIGSALGDSVYAIVVSDKFPGGVFTTDERFDPRFGISRTNAPFTAGDLLPSPNSPDGTWEVIDWPTGGPSFENASGMRVQLENDNIAAELSPSNDMDAQPRGSQFTDPDMLPVDSEMRQMAVAFIENDLQGQVRDDKIEDAKRLFVERATDPNLAQRGFGVRQLLDGAFREAQVDNPRNRAQRFNPDDQRAIGGAAGGGVMDVRWPRGIDEQELGVVAGNMSDDGYDRELYSPLNQAQLPTDPQTLIRLAEVMEEYADIRRDVSADYDGQGWYLRVAGVIYQAAADQMNSR
jgi:hypothetical protein